MPKENIIAKKRKEKGLTQQELSNKVGCSVTAISLYERGAFKPNAERGLKLAKIFGMSYEDLAKELGI